MVGRCDRDWCPLPRALNSGGRIFGKTCIRDSHVSSSAIAGCLVSRKIKQHATYEGRWALGPLGKDSPVQRLFCLLVLMFWAGKAANDKPDQIFHNFPSQFTITLQARHPVPQGSYDKLAKFFPEFSRILFIA